MLIIFTVILTAGQGQAYSDIRLQHDVELIISKDFIRGSYLIYDCRHSHFACVNKDSADKCRGWREKAQRKGQDNLQCAPLRPFISSEKCVQEQQKQVDHPQNLYFCQPTEMLNLPSDKGTK